MKYGQLVQGNRVNKFIYHCFDLIPEKEVIKLIKKFRNYSNNLDQQRHTFSELILGAFLHSEGYNAKYEIALNGITPDWTIVKDNSIFCIIELVNFQIDFATRKEIKKNLLPGNVIAFWRDESKDNVSRLWHILKIKFQKYHKNVNKLDMPFVVGIYPEFIASITLDELRFCLLNEQSGLFHNYPEVSGVFHIYESKGYIFNYINNPTSSQRFDLPNGKFE